MKQRRAWAAGITVVSSVWAAGEGLVVVHEGPGTVAAAAYLVRAEVSAERARAALEQARAQLLDGEGFGELPAAFPVVPGPLRYGAPARVRVRGLPQYVFVIGADAGSLAWLQASARWLRERRALGVVVAAGTAADFEIARAVVREVGLDVVPAPGEALATGYGVTTYPAVLEPSR